MTIARTTTILSIALASVAVPPLHAQDATVHEERAALGARRESTGSGAIAPSLIAPQMPATRIQLPPTELPSDALRTISGDLNADGNIDAIDLAALLDQYGACPVGHLCQGDLDNDGHVDQADLLILLNTRLGQTVPQPPAGVERAERVQVGYVQPVAGNLLANVQLQQNAAGNRVARVELQSPKAKGLRIQFANLRESGTNLRVFDPAPGGVAVLGPFSSPGFTEDGLWWSPTIYGDTIGLEFEAATDKEQAQLPIITAIAYIYTCDCSTGPGTPLSCHNDVTCQASWANGEARGVGQISFISGSSCVICTGALLARGNGDFSPIFMTARHCVSTQAEAGSLEVRWLYQTATCNGAVPGWNTVPRTNGSLLLKIHGNTDWTLLGLYQPPGGDVYLGWNAGSWASGGGATGVHHPNGSFKRISTGTSSGSTDGQQFCDTSTPPICFNANVWNVSYTSGTTEGGSSGSPIFDANRQVRGTLSGGPSGCATVTKRYGRLDQAWNNLRYYIDSNWIPFTNTFVNRNVSGDAGNDGSSEQGTAANPFNSVYEASFCVRGGETLQITPGNYNEQMTIWRPMTLRLNGTGTVVIGQ